HEDEIQAELSRIGNIDDILKSGLPPILEMVNAPAGKIRNRDLTLKLKLTDRGGGIGKIVFRVNGIEYGIPQGTKPIGHIGMKSSGMIIRKDFTLKNGLNTITATAYNKDDKIESKPLEFILNVDDPRSYEPDLYGLCIGITNYLDYDLKLKYAADDALSMRKELETRATPLFKNVDVRALTDRQASTDGIISAFKEMSLKIRPNDVFVLYMSGHGKALDTRYHFIPWGMRYKNEESIRQYSLSHDKIQELMAMIRAQKSLIILDTCYSGSVVAPSKGMPEKTAIDRLMRATGRATLAATSDKALAYEGHNGHGIFTHAILKGLEAHADRKGNRNGETGIDELANFVQDEVPRITFDKFGFEQIPMHSVTGHSFPIGCCKGYNRPGCRP
ncbi:MAG: caspase family protein, partial [Desulfobacteraceae bacterium]|nr:caspase family protein [Desulfobacteraceae bacterium]